MIIASASKAHLHQILKAVALVITWMLNSTRSAVFRPELAALKNAEDKAQCLRSRMEQQRQLGAHIDTIMRQADAEITPGCSVCHIWRRLTGKQRTVALAAAAEATANSANGVASAAASFQAQSRLFGVRKADPHTKLAEAASSMEARISQLECRAASEREEAKRLAAAGQKASALRALKRAKATEKQLEANQQSLMAIEQQVDMMAQAQMQKQLATALASSSKGMKSQKKLLKSAESAVDDAQDARDMAEDLGNVMAEFAQNGNGNEDEDELMEELNAMMNEPPPNVLSSIPETEPAASTSAEAAETARKEEIAMLEARVARWDEAMAVRNALPAAPSVSKKDEEKAHLLRAVPAN